jgi:hypothetical protein
VVEVDSTRPLIRERGAATLLDAFEGHWMLIAYYFMWHASQSNEREKQMGLCRVDSFSEAKSS